MKLNTLIILLFLSSSLIAQNPLWNANFSNDPFGFDPLINWTTDFNPSGNQFPWQWTPNGTAENGPFWNGRPPIASPSGNGAILFDSDGFSAEFPVPHVAIANSPLIQLPPTNAAFLEFYQYYRNFESHVRIELLDLEIGEPIPIFDNQNIGKNVETEGGERVVIDLTGLILPGSVFQIRFIFEGAFYFWMIDDMTIYDGYPYLPTFPTYIGDSLISFNKDYDIDPFDAPVVPNQLVVQFKPGTSPMDKQNLRDSLGVVDFEACMCDLLELWNLGDPISLPFDTFGGLSPFGPGAGIDQVKSTASASSKVDGVDLNRYTWGELKTATDTAQGPILNIPSANPFPGKVRVAILDTGIDYEHPSLADLIWKEQDEDVFDCLPGDTIGWNFVNDNNNPMDNHSHGTHLAGIVAKNMEDFTDCVNLEILAVKTHDENGTSDLFDVACGMYYALQHGANVINCSWGWLGDSSQIISNAIDTARLNYNAVVVAATGNDTINLNQVQQFPACNPQDNLVAVAATNASGTEISPFSNFSSLFTNIAAPGEDIISTVPGGEFLEKSGTSMAAPAVAAAVAAVYCANEQETSYREAVDCVLESADQQNALSDLIEDGKVLNFSLSSCIVSTKAIDLIDPMALIAPNPTASNVDITLIEGWNKVQQIAITNQLGQIMWQNSVEHLFNGEKIQINLGNWPAGVYFLHIVADTQKWSTPLVKQ